MSEQARDRGLGDTIARATQALGIKPCGGCKKRQEWLNRVLPYERTETVPTRNPETPQVQPVTPIEPVRVSARERVVIAARSWLGTPYHLGGRVKGSGCDCATLLFEVYRECGLVPDQELERASHDWFQHTDEEPYLFAVMRHAHKVAETIASRAVEALPGCLVLTRAAGSRVYNHGGIVTVWPRVIHAGPQGVEEVNATMHPLWAHHLIVIFDPWKADDVRE
jgi:cell wall-associated NlpC family hydrolase